MSRERRRFFDFDMVVVWGNTYVLLVWANTYVGLCCRDIARLEICWLPDPSANGYDFQRCRGSDNGFLKLYGTSGIRAIALRNGNGVTTREHDDRAAVGCRARYEFRSD